LYGIGRFAIEFLRDDLRGAVGALSTSQFISLFIVAGGIAILVIHRTFDKKSFKREA
jgi:phosphatidylglycerol:prolipoprotein diacylglycerol transferase